MNFRVVSRMSLYKLIWAVDSSGQWAVVGNGQYWAVGSSGQCVKIAFSASKSRFWRRHRVFVVTNHVFCIKITLFVSEVRFFLVFHQKLIKIEGFRGSRRYHELRLEICCKMRLTRAPEAFI